MTVLRTQWGIGIGVILLLIIIAFQVGQNSQQATEEAVETQIAAALTEIAVAAPSLTPLPASAHHTHDDTVTTMESPTPFLSDSTPIPVDVSEKFTRPLPEGSFGFVNWSTNADSLVISVTGIVQVWDTTAGDLIEQWEASVFGLYAFALAPDGATLATTTAGSLDLWSTPSGRYSGQVGNGCCQDGIAWSPDGTKLAGGSSTEIVRIWNVQSGNELLTINTQDRPVQLIWNDDGHELIVNERDGKITFWNIDTGELTNTLNADVHSFALMPDGSIVGDHGEGTIAVYTDTDELLFTFEAHTDYISALALSPDGLLLATGSADETITIWDTASWRRAASNT